MRSALVCRWLGAIVLALLPATAGAQDTSTPAPPAAGGTSSDGATLIPSAPPALEEALGRPVLGVALEPLPSPWRSPRLDWRRFPRGAAFSPELARRALEQVMATGAFASAEVALRRERGGVVLVVRAVPRRLIAALQLRGGTLEEVEALRAFGLTLHGELTVEALEAAERRLEAAQAARGYPAARVSTQLRETDDPLAVALDVDVTPGPPLLLVSRRWRLDVPDERALAELREHDVELGRPVDAERLTEADRELERRLRARGFTRASVRHRLAVVPGGRRLELDVRLGPELRLRFEGVESFDEAALRAELSDEQAEERTPGELAEVLRQFYVARGFLDAQIRVRELGAATERVNEWRFQVREGERLRVTRRRYPCLSGVLSASELDDEIDSFLAELPGAGVLGVLDPRAVDASFGPTGTTGARPVPLQLNPYEVYTLEVYEKIIEHLKALYRSEGYYSAVVGPAQVLRRRCAPGQPPGECRPLPQVRVAPRCARDELGLPREEPALPPSASCTADLARGQRCAPEATLWLPISPGPRTTLWDLAFEGNQRLSEARLAETAALSLGEPLSQDAIERARRRLLDAYAELGFAFAEVQSELEFSRDRSRARLRWVVSERGQVRVTRVVVQGAERTSGALIRERIALKVGEPYRQSWVRQTEEQLAALGVFASVTVGLEDPYTPARDKAVVVSVKERMPQYLDVRPGFSTGEGFRVGFEYGHRNLFAHAIQLTLRVQLAYLPPTLILESDTRRKYEELDVGSRLERRNSATLELPDTGLGPLFRLSLEGVDVRDNARDFGLVKDAGIVTLSYRPLRRLSAQLGASFELNTAEIFGSREKDALSDYVAANPGRAGAFRVPSGTTFAKAQRLGLQWDGRDDPFAATSGVLAAASLEHVRADPVGATAALAGGAADVFAPTTSQFLRWRGRVAGYLRLSRRGLTLATSLRAGINQQLLTPCRRLPLTEQTLGNCSQTYPDRLFFMGGVDSLRGFAQDSLVPEDVAARLLDPSSGLSARQVVLRGGDVYLNPRLELRVPLGDQLSTALFFDAGNLWVDPALMQPLRLRYSIGSGLRLGTPVGPLVFDYGFNLERLTEELGLPLATPRPWEDLGAFHFSIGLL